MIRTNDPFWQRNRTTSMAHHQQIHDHLMTLLESKSFIHGSIIAGPDYVGKTDFTLNLYKAHLCSGGNEQSLFGGTESSSGGPCNNCASCKQITSKAYPDLLFVEKPEDKTVISVSQIREYIKKAYQSPVGGGYKFFIIKDAHTMTREASNALLKTLEEPPASCLLFLITSKPESLLETIQSRCQSIVLPRVMTPDSDVDQQLWNRSRGLPEKYRTYSVDADAITFEQEELKIFLDFLLASKGQRLQQIEQWFKKKGKHALQKEDWKKRYTLWTLTLRDLLMVQLGSNDSVGFPEVLPLNDQLESIDLVKAIDSLIGLQEQLHKSFNLRLSLEQFAISL